MPKSRDRHLAKNAERRRLERTRAKRSKQAALGVGGVIAAVLLVLLGIGILSRDSTAGDRHADPDPVGLRAGRRLADQDRDRDRAGDAGREGGLRRRGARVGVQAETAVRSGARTRRGPQEEHHLHRDDPDLLRPDHGASSTSRPRRKRSRTSCSWPSRGISTASSSRGSSIRSMSCRRATPRARAGAGRATRSPMSSAARCTTAPGRSRWPTRGANTGGSQFFLITGPDGANLDGNPNYTIFGQVTEGLDVAKQINGVDADERRQLRRAADRGRLHRKGHDRGDEDTAAGPQPSPSG